MSLFYNAVLRRNSTFMAFFITVGVAAEQIFELNADSLFDSINKGRQFKDIQHKYE